MISLFFVNVASASPIAGYGRDHFFSRVMEVEVACNVPVSYEARLDDTNIDAPEQYHSYPRVDVSSCGVSHLRKALQASLDASPCAYVVEEGWGGLVVAPAIRTSTGCRIAPSRLDEPVPGGLHNQEFWSVLLAEGKDFGRLRMNQHFYAPVKDTTMREMIHDMMKNIRYPDGRKGVYRVHDSGTKFNADINFATAPGVWIEGIAGPYDARTQWWRGDRAPRYRQPTDEEFSAFSSKRELYRAGKMSDLEFDTIRADYIRSRVLNPLPDGEDWPDVRLIISDGMYDENGCLPDSRCALRHKDK